MYKSLRDINIEAVEQFACYQCMSVLRKGPYEFMGNNFIRSDYNYICEWFKANCREHLIGFTHYHLLQGIENEFISGHNLYKIYCPQHYAISSRLHYIDCVNCFDCYSCVWYTLNDEYCTTYTKWFFRIESPPEHICNRIDMEIFLDKCIIGDLDYHNCGGNISSEQKEAMLKHLFPNRVKSAANC